MQKLSDLTSKEKLQLFPEMENAIRVLVCNACDNGEAFPDDPDPEDPRDEDGDAWYGDWFAAYQVVRKLNREIPL